MPKRTDPIAVFDSGVGGISVLRELIRLMPQEHYLYYGDSRNAPYGPRDTQEVRELTGQAADMLLGRGAKALVIACNTATSAAVRYLREKYPQTVIVGIEPALKIAADRFPGGHIGVMATEMTLREEKLAQQLARFPGLTVEKIPAPGLVEMIEQGQLDTPQVCELLQKLLGTYRGKLDALVLGCTHYPFVRQAVSEILGEKIAILDGSAGTARETKRRLAEQNLLSAGPGSVQMENSLPTPEILSLCMRLLEM